MALTPSLTVRVEGKPPASFGDTMNEMRSWLDHAKIQPASFKSIPVAGHGIGFEIAFNSEEEAQRFHRAFA